MVSTKLAVESGTIRSVSMYTPRAPAARLDRVPIAIGYAITFFISAPHLEFDEEGGVVFAVPLLAFPVMVLIHALTWLSTHWSVGFKTATQFNGPQQINMLKDNAKIRAGIVHLAVDPDPHYGKPALVKVILANGVPSFTYQNQIFLWNEQEIRFQPLQYPTNYDVSVYRGWKGHVDRTAFEAARTKWGDNKVNLPIPTFGELYKEHALAPFFVFQMFCVALWMLDEYWQYSLMTFFLLCTFEATVIKSRLKHMQDIRNMLQPPYSVNVYREGKWISVSSNALVPGDIMSITRPPKASSAVATAAGSKAEPGSISTTAKKRAAAAQAERVAPCDLLILQGSAIVNEALLTGESIPQSKESIASARPEDALDVTGAHRGHVVFGGTKVLQAKREGESIGVPRPPDDGALGYVLQTGFETSQGQLLRTILHSQDRVSANNVEAFVFIGFLLIFAIAASGYVLIKGLEDESRSRWKLVLNCTFILTSVIPPELPMELSMAVNNSLIALMKTRIFCTEPFRIPFCGKIDVACFDKTGTLTTEQLILQGVGGLNDGLISSAAMDVCPASTIWTIAGCQSLAILDGEMVGDPMEKAALNAIGWKLDRADTVISGGRGKKTTISILNRFAFSSALKRSSTVATLESVADGGGMPSRKTYVFAKGAPETMQTRFATLPADYVKTFRSFAAKGGRVLALGFKEGDSNRPRSIERDEAETGLTFAGFLVYSCPIKVDSAAAVDSLNSSGHWTVMITGDNALTAAHVAGEVGLTNKPVIFADASGPSLKWVSAMQEPVEREAQSSLVQKYDLCVDGTAMTALVDGATDVAWDSLVGHVKVYARVSPGQKETILSSLKRLGYVTMMVGDGTNDVAALKQAHVGVALLNSSPTDDGDLEREKAEAAKSPVAGMGLMERLQYEKNRMAELQRKAKEKVDADIAAGKRGKGAGPEARAAIMEAQRKEFRRLMAEAQADMAGPQVRLGDASIASPFTAKSSSPLSVASLVRQGRCTLFTTLQMYKILALNCLITAYSLSALYLEGIKFGDTQMTVTGMLMAVCFMALTFSKPAEKLSRARPPPNIYTPYIFLSVMGQFAVHMACLLKAKWMAEQAEDDLGQGVGKDVCIADLEEEFKVGLVNSAVFLVWSAMQVSSFAVNCRGWPFMADVRTNRVLVNCLTAVAGLTLAAGSGMLPGISEWLEIAPHPTAEYGNMIVFLILTDFVGAYVVEETMLKLFPYKEKSAAAEREQ